MYKELEEYEAALADYSKAIELDPKSVTAYRYRAYLYDKLGRGGAARDDFNRILELDPGNADATKALKRLGPDLRREIVR
jgi:Tfp pilus assembly protein PilF